MTNKKKCFRCHEGASNKTISSLELHKHLYETTGTAYWVFKKDNDSKIQIADENSFKVIIEQIKGNPGAEWHHIAEFGQTADDNISANPANKKSKASKSKSKPKPVRKPLEGNL